MKKIVISRSSFSIALKKYYLALRKGTGHCHVRVEDGGYCYVVDENSRHVFTGEELDANPTTILEARCSGTFDNQKYVSLEAEVDAIDLNAEINRIANSLLANYEVEVRQ